MTNVGEKTYHKKVSHSILLYPPVQCFSLSTAYLVLWYLLLIVVNSGLQWSDWSHHLLVYWLYAFFEGYCILFHRVDPDYELQLIVAGSVF